MGAPWLGMRLLWVLLFASWCRMCWRFGFIHCKYSLNSTFTAGTAGAKSQAQANRRSCGFPWSRQSWHYSEPFQDLFGLMLLNEFVQSSALVLGATSFCLPLCIYPQLKQTPMWSYFLRPHKEHGLLCFVGSP